MALAAVAGGCVDNTSGLVATTSDPARAGRGPVSAAGVSLAFVAVEGAPQDITARFTQMTAAEAARRQVAVTDAPAALYLVRGYLAAQTVENGTSLTYVWDVFDRSRRRIQRSEDAILLAGAAANPWSVVDDRALASLAARSADDIAAVLAARPEALAARSAPAAVASSGSSVGGSPVSAGFR
jgi:hypothetical protein